jgi:hypothetical protein
MQMRCAGGLSAAQVIHLQLFGALTAAVVEGFLEPVRLEE